MKGKQVIMPFGKYKGQPIEVVLEQKSYCNWLTGQKWFQEQNSHLYTLIINNFSTERLDTPEHNKMQIKFMDKIHKLKLAYLASGGKLFQGSNQQFKENVANYLAAFRDKNINISGFIRNLRNHNGHQLLHMKDMGAEEKGLDVWYEVSYGYGGCFSYRDDWVYRSATEIFNRVWDEASFVVEIRLEIKPSVGDDYPTVLRQMKASKANVLLLREYNSAAVSFDDFKRFFESQGKKVFTEKELEEAKLPQYDETFYFAEALCSERTIAHCGA